MLRDARASFAQATLDGPGLLRCSASRRSVTLRVLSPHRCTGSRLLCHTCHSSEASGVARWSTNPQRWRASERPSLGRANRPPATRSERGVGCLALPLAIVAPRPPPSPLRSCRRGRRPLRVVRCRLRLPLLLSARVASRKDEEILRSRVGLVPSGIMARCDRVSYMNPMNVDPLGSDAEVGARQLRSWSGGVVQRFLASWRILVVAFASGLRPCAGKCAGDHPGHVRVAALGFHSDRPRLVRLPRGADCHCVPSCMSPVATCFNRHGDRRPRLDAPPKSPELLRFRCVGVGDSGCVLFCVGRERVWCRGLLEVVLAPVLSQHATGPFTRHLLM